MKQFFRFMFFLLISLSIPLTATAQDGIIEGEPIDPDAEFEPMIDEAGAEFEMPDWHLRAAINAALGKGADTPTPITIVEMAQLTILDAQHANISDLTGLEFAINLEWLILNNNNISDLSPLAGLINLRLLWLDNNNISDLSPLVANAGLGNEDIVIVNGNPLSAVSIKTHIPALQSRGVIIPVTIPDPNLRAAIESVLGKAKEEAPTTADMAQLTRLDARNANISDLTGLEFATNLTELYLGDAYVETERRWLNSNSVSNLSPLAELTKLTKLSLRNNNISDISPLAGLANLTQLWADNNNITDISAVVGLTSLTYLNLGGNNITDILPVAGLTNLTNLALANNGITDIAAVVELIHLTELHLGWNKISDISPLASNTGLGSEDTVNVKGNPLSYQSIYTHIPTLQSRGVTVEFDRPVETLSGHTDGVVSVAFSLADNILASGGRDGTVRLWDVNTEQLLYTFTGHTAMARSVAFSPDGSILASGGHDGTVRLWDVATRTPIDILTGHTAGVESVAFTPDGTTLASGSHDGTVRLWNPVTGQPIEIVADGLGTVWSVAYSPDGNSLAIGFDSGIIVGEVSGTRPPKFLLEHTAWVESIAFSPDGTMLASGSGDNTVRLWNVATGQSIDTLTGHIAGINSVAFSPDGTILASASDDKTVRLWDPLTGDPIDTLTGHTSWVRSVAFNRDGSILASGSGDSTVRLWELAPSTVEFRLSIPVGINLIHVPLKVTAVNDVAQPIEWVADLYDALGGASKVTYLITYDSETQEWLSYFGAPDKDLPGNAKLTPDKGVMVSLKTEVSVHLRGSALGTDGVSTVTLRQGANLVGLPLNDSRIKRVSDLLALDGIGGNVPVIILTDGGDFKLVGRAGDPSDIEITGGQAFIMNAQREEEVEISGEGWTNPLGTAAAPPMLTGIQVTDTTPVLALRGAIVDEGTSLKVSNFRVTVKNLSTGKSVTGMIKDNDRAGYRLTVVDIETMRAATVGDALEISARTPDPFIGVEPLRYTVTAEDVKRSLIQLPALVAYAIPAETELLPNYPNPFNPETWIPYRLAEDALVTLTIYDGTGRVVRSLDVGHQVAAVYENRSKAIYWDGRNEFGEQVASGLYFYHLSAGDYSKTRRMVILK